MKMDKLVSIIVPIYNVEKYLGKCIESLVSQTYTNIEIILVNDGSPDHSDVICEEWAKKDARIRILNKVNGGLSDARNAGLEIANGELICFVDSDDWVENETIERAVNAIEDVDMVIWGYYCDTVDENEKVLSTTYHKHNGICDRKEGYKILESPDVMGLSGYAWNKLYKRELIDSLRFEKGISLVEDVLFNSPYMCKCEKVKYIDFLGLHYIQRNRSTLGTKFYPNFLSLKISCAEARTKMMIHFGASEEDVKRFIGREYIAVFRSAIRIISNQKWKYNERREKCMNLLKSDEAKKIVDSAITRNFSDKMVLMLARTKMVDLLLLLSRK